MEIGQSALENLEMTEFSLFNEVYNGTKVLITGDTGFKGSWLAIWLKMLGADVFGYALPPPRSQDNFVKSDLQKVITHRDGDIRNKENLLAYFKEVQPDIAFHLAAQPIVLESYRNPHYTFETNIIGTVNFFEAVRNTKSIKAAINITSDKCYQNNDWIWGYRESDPLGGKDPYSASKGCSELITNSYLSSFFSSGSGCAIASARAGNVIGGGDWSENRIVPDCIKAIESGDEIIIRNPSSFRPWQFVLEPLRGYLLLGEKLLSHKHEFSGAWNFGPLNSGNISVENLVKKIVEVYGDGNYKICEDKNAAIESSCLSLDISKAGSKLNWKPVLTIDETIKLTVEWYKNYQITDVYNLCTNQIKKYSGINQLKPALI